MTMISIQIWQTRVSGGRGFGEPFDPLPYTPPTGTPGEPDAPIGPPLEPGVGQGLRWTRAAVRWGTAGVRWV